MGGAQPALPKSWVGQSCRFAQTFDGARERLRYNTCPMLQPGHEAGRQTPSKGVKLSLAGQNWVFLTVCTKDRERWLADRLVQQALHCIWEKKATAWLVSDYLLMLDHIHLFCAPHNVNFTIERWIGFWKDCFAKQVGKSAGFQPGGFHHRLRSDESYADKWRYVRENPVRQGLVKQSEGWPYFGRVRDIRI